MASDADKPDDINTTTDELAFLEMLAKRKPDRMSGRFVMTDPDEVRLVLPGDPDAEMPKESSGPESTS